ncbi:Putative ribonuclease H protein [Arachis hypogaea]|nr:Putative ribonuclease H protein [Arachis hypogaea]
MKHTVTAHNNLIRWFPPAEDVIKLNVDGSFYENQNNAACGVVFRDHLGRYIAGFSCNLGSCSIKQVEIWGVVCGLQIAVAKNFHQIIVETDSTSVLELVKSGCVTRHPCASLLADINIQAQRLIISEWTHTLREANYVADILAK